MMKHPEFTEEELAYIYRLVGGHVIGGPCKNRDTNNKVYCKIRDLFESEGREDILRSCRLDTETPEEVPANRMDVIRLKADPEHPDYSYQRTPNRS